MRGRCINVSFTSGSGSTRKTLRSSYIIRALRASFRVKIVTKGADVNVVCGPHLASDHGALCTGRINVHHDLENIWRVWDAARGEPPPSDFVNDLCRQYDLMVGYAGPGMDAQKFHYLPLWAQAISWHGRRVKSTKDRYARGTIPCSWLDRPRRNLGQRFALYVARELPTDHGLAHCALPFRESIVRKLSSIRPVDCCGGHLNNRKLPGDCKLRALKRYKFGVALENCDLPGNVTEKILQTLVMGAIPVYWGAPDIGRYFNERRMVVVDTENIAESVDRVRFLDSHRDAYEAIQREPIFVRGALDPFQPRHLAQRIASLL